MTNPPHPQVLLIVRFKSSLTAEELERRYTERFPSFRSLPGLLQKYYLHDPATDEWGGFYLWESQASLDEFLGSDLRRSIPEVYAIEGTPRMERIEVIDVLRPERI